MGNRAVMVFDFGGGLALSGYVHWNGGPESVYAIVDYVANHPNKDMQTIAYGVQLGYKQVLDIDVQFSPCTPDMAKDLCWEDNGVYAFSYAMKDGIRELTCTRYARKNYGEDFKKVLKARTEQEWKIAKNGEQYKDIQQALKENDVKQAAEQEERTKKNLEEFKKMMLARQAAERA